MERQLNTTALLRAVIAAGILSTAAAARADDRPFAHAPPPAPHDPVAGTSAAQPGPRPDLSGEKRLGIASFYADNFFGRTMADGTPMDPNGSNAASRTLPLGTKAEVTNLETGKSATVVIKDRGPYAKGRIVDLSPATAQRIGITRRKGISKVVVAPITVPQPDGTVKRGAAAKATEPMREAALVAPSQNEKVRENAGNDGQRTHHE